MEILNPWGRPVVFPSVLTQMHIYRERRYCPVRTAGVNCPWQLAGSVQTSVLVQDPKSREAVQCTLPNVTPQRHLNKALAPCLDRVMHFMCLVTGLKILSSIGSSIAWTYLIPFLFLLRRTTINMERRSLGSHLTFWEFSFLLVIAFLVNEELHGKATPEVDNSDCLSGRLGTGQETQFFYWISCLHLNYIFPKVYHFQLSELD